VISGSVPFLWLCGPSGVGKSAVGYQIFQQVYRSGIKAGFMDFDQLGLCYPTPADDPHNHQVKAQNLGAVWPTYRVAGARRLIAVGGVTSRETVLCYAAQVPDTRLTLCRLRATPERLTERVFRRGLGRARSYPGRPRRPPSSSSRRWQPKPSAKLANWTPATSPICASTRTTTTSLRSPSTYARRPAAGLSWPRDPRAAG
jgi:hypothetical protein